MQKEKILLRKEKYFHTSIQEVETMEFKENNEEEVRDKSANNKGIQAIRKALEKADKEMKNVALELCQWEDGYHWHQGKIWIPNNKGIRTNLIQ